MVKDTLTIKFKEMGSNMEIGLIISELRTRHFERIELGVGNYIIEFDLGYRITHD